MNIHERYRYSLLSHDQETVFDEIGSLWRVDWDEVVENFKDWESEE